MHYFVTLDGQPFPLTPERDGARFRVATGQGSAKAGSLDVEILSSGEHSRPAVVLVDGRVVRVLLREPGAANGNLRPARIDGLALTANIETELERRARPIRNKAASSGTRVVAPMPGRVVKVSVRPGDDVVVGAALVSIEAMKMENELTAPSAGRVTKVLVTVGATVDAEQELVTIEPV